MTSSHDDKKKPGVAKGPTDSESVGLSTVPRRRIVVGADPKAGSSNPPAESGASTREATSEGRSKRSSAPAHLRNRRGQLSGTGYSEAPANAEERVAPSAIPRAPRVPRIEGEGGVDARPSGGKAKSVRPASRGGAEASSSAARTPAPVEARPLTADQGDRSVGAGANFGSRTMVGVLGQATRRALESASGEGLVGKGAGGSEPRAEGAPRRSDTARSISTPVLTATEGEGALDRPADDGPLSGGTTALGVPAGRLTPSSSPPSLADVEGHFDIGPPTDANFPPVYAPSGTLQSMSAVRPEQSSPPLPGKFTTTLTGSGYLSPAAREILAQAERDSQRLAGAASAASTFGSAAGGPESIRFAAERTILGMPRLNEGESAPAPAIRRSPPPVVLSDAHGDSLLAAIAEAAQGQLRESEIPVPSERLEAAVLEQLGQLDEALKSSPRVPSFDRPASSRPARLPAGRAEDRVSDSSARVESAPGSSIDAPSPGSVPPQSALPGEGSPGLGPAGLPTVGRYEVLARLKSGGMGSVYMCRLSGNAGFRRLFAMKVLHAHLNRDAEALESFQREARVLGCVHHPNIVGVVDFGSEREPYIVLEYVEGGSLHELMRATTGGRDPRLVLTIILDVLEGLAAAHGANDEEGNPLGLVHCDVCPQNILVGVDGTARLTDFGIAQTNESRLRPELLRGKPRYLAPERTTTSSVDARVDLFSLGVVLYAALTGVEPFAGETAEQTRWNVANKAVPAPSTVGLRPPPALDWLCLKALSKDPAGRFQSAEEMASQLRRIAEREGLLAPRNEVSEWVRVTLAPSLAARRVASRRGTVTGTGRLGSQTPPGVHASEAGGGFRPSRGPSAPPSSAENTAPLSADPGDFSENTEVIAGDGQARLRSRRVLYGMLALCLGILLWGILAPESLARMFAIEDPAPSAGDTEAVDDDPIGAIVPDVGPSFEGSSETPSPEPKEEEP